MKDRRLIVGATGASGMPLLVKCLTLLRQEENRKTVLILTKGAELTLSHETDYTKDDLKKLCDEYYNADEIAAGPASGSYETCGMLVVPCSMKTLAGIHSGYADNLLLRAADVQLKEKRPLALCVRESPLSPVQLRNMQELSMLPNVHIIPPMLSFYHRPETLDEMVFQIAARLLAPFGIEVKDSFHWNGTET